MKLIPAPALEGMSGGEVNAVEWWDKARTWRRGAAGMIREQSKYSSKAMRR